MAAFTLLILWAPAHASSKTKPSPRFLVVKRLQAGLAGTPLAPYAWALEREGRRWDVNPFLVAAIAGAESSFGAAACGGNAWGIASCGMTFASFREGVAFTTRLLRLSYLDQGRRDVVSVGAKYCPGCSRWPGSVAWFMRARFGSPPTVTYPG